MNKLKKILDINGFVTTHSLKGLVVMNRLTENMDKNYYSTEGLFSYIYKEDDVELYLMNNSSILVTRNNSNEEEYIAPSIIVSYSRLKDA